MRAIPALVLVLTLSACSHSRMAVARLGPQDADLPPVPPRLLLVFSGPDCVVPAFQPMARLSVAPRYSSNHHWEVPKIQEALVERAARLGAHGLILEEITAHPHSGPGGEEIWGSAVAIRFTDRESGWSSAVARHPRALSSLFVAPVTAPADLLVPDSVLQVFGKFIREELRGAGFSVAPEEISKTMWHRRARGAWRRHDPTVGGLVVAQIRAVEADFQGHEAEWDGASQRVGRPRSFLANLASAFLTLLLTNEDEVDAGGVPTEGTVWAFSLEVHVKNQVGADIYHGMGGIELLEKADFEGGIWIGEPTPEAYNTVEVPPEGSFRREGRMRRAVTLAFRGLTGRS